MDHWSSYSCGTSQKNHGIYISSPFLFHGNSLFSWNILLSFSFSRLVYFTILSVAKRYSRFFSLFISNKIQFTRNTNLEPCHGIAPGTVSTGAKALRGEFFLCYVTCAQNWFLLIISTFISIEFFYLLICFSTPTCT